MEKTYSVNKVPIRLSFERWYHITENHEELAGFFHEVLDAVENPHFVMQGNQGTLKATKNLGKKKWLVVIYREISMDDGFIITSFFLPAKPKGKIVWKI
jgi:hypothetical protein